MNLVIEKVENCWHIKSTFLWVKHGKWNSTSLFLKNFFFTIFILLVEKLVSEYIEGILDIKIEDHK